MEATREAPTVEGTAPDTVTPAHTPDVQQNHAAHPEAQHQVAQRHLVMMHLTTQQLADVMQALHPNQQEEQTHPEMAMAA